MIVSLPSREIGAAALAAALLLAGCSSDSDVPPTVASAPGGGTQQNTDTGSGGSFPDVNTTPTQRPTSTIQDLNQAPEGLSGAQSGTQYGESLIGGPTSSAEPPAPPPPPEPELAPIPEPGIQTQTSDATPVEAEPQPSYPVETPEVAEAQPEPEPAPVPTGEGQTIQGTMGEAQPQPEPQPEPEPQPAPVAVAPQPPEPQPMPQPQPMAPLAAPQYGAEPVQPQAQLALQPGSVQTPSLGAAQPQLPAAAYGPNYRALAPDAYGVSFPQPVLPAYQGYNPAQAIYRSPYANPPTNYGGVANGNGAPVISSQTAALVAPSYDAQAYGAPTYGAYGQPSYSGGQQVGLIYFREGSSNLSSDDREVLKQIAEIQRANGGVVHVVGHASMRTTSTDYARHQEANLRVSESRAKVVAQQLMRYGVPEGAIQWAAAGDSQPLYSEVMPSGEAANRRAEVYISAY
jgi:outer membrane protein OmpA-like peptidoglycan-associated protein